MSEKSTFAKKRSAFLKRKTISELMQMRDILLQANELRAKGDTEGYERLLSSTKDKLEAKIAECNVTNSELDGNLKIDRDKIPAPGEVLAKNDKIILKMIASNEKPLYIRVSYECSSEKYMYDDEKYVADLWDSRLADCAVVASIYDTVQNAYVGYCMIKDIRKKDWEIAIEELEEYRNQGYGYNALSMFISNIRLLTNHRFFRARIDVDNIASQGLFRKLGAYPDGISEFDLHGTSLEEFRKENADEINDNIRAIAEEFCVEPEDLLGMVLEYRIDTGE